MTEARPMIRFIARLAADQRGATAIEYGLIAALIAVVIVTAVSNVGKNLNTTFGNIANAAKK